MPVPADPSDQQLDIPDDPDSLYDARIDVPLYFPLKQGDVFQDVAVTVLGDEPQSVMVVMHPCTMRRGPDLHRLITVAPITPHNGNINDAVWRRHVRVMPLPALRGSADEEARFLDITAVTASSLTLDKRAATLSNEGVILLQQRLIFHHSRFVVDRPTLHRQAAPVLTELELQADWVERVLNTTANEAMKIADTAAREFQSWLSEDGRRERLNDDTAHAGLRRDARREAGRRYPAPA